MYVTVEELATLGMFAIGNNPEGFTMYANGDDFAPALPTYVVGGVVPTLVVEENFDPQETLEKLVDLIEKGRNANATTFGGWRHEGKIYFDMGEFFDAEFVGLKRVTETAVSREEIAIGFFMNGEYAASLNV